MKANNEKMWYDASVVMRNIPEIMGLEMTRKETAKGYQWVGPYRLTGERCGHRKDKLKVFAWKGTIWVQEEGEPLMSLQRWLVEYGGCADYGRAGRVLRLADPTRRVKECVINPKARREVGKYVDDDEWRKYAAYIFDDCPLYNCLCRMFSSIEAMGAFWRYKSTTNERGEMVYWYIDIDGQICHDKVMSYKWDGHRDKNRGGWRKFTTTDGYSNRCYFGSHLLGENVDGRRVMVVEGEKTAMMCSIVWPDYIWLATGGKNQLRDVEKGWTLLPDLDAADEWSNRGAVSRWWEGCDGVSLGDHADIGDVIEAYARRGDLERLKNEENIEKLLKNI